MPSTKPENALKCLTWLYFLLMTVQYFSMHFTSFKFQSKQLNLPKVYNVLNCFWLFLYNVVKTLLTVSLMHFLFPTLFLLTYYFFYRLIFLLKYIAVYLVLFCKNKYYFMLYFCYQCQLNPNNPFLHSKTLELHWFLCSSIYWVFYTQSIQIIKCL